MAFPSDLGVTYSSKIAGQIIYTSDVNNLQTEVQALKVLCGITGSADSSSFNYKMSAITGTEKALSTGSAAQSASNKTFTLSTYNGVNLSTSAGASLFLAGDGTYRSVTVSNATTTQQGAVELATGAEVAAGTTTGGTGASLVATADYAVPAGTVLSFAGSTTPHAGWLLCDGSAVSRTTYAVLFSVIGTTFGSGDGSTTFNVPDLRSRSVIGVGTGTKVATFASRASNVITVTGLTNAANNEFQTGQAVVYNTSGTVITGLTNATTYYVIRVTNTSFSLATSLANANAGTAITLSSDGTGTQTFTKTFTARTRGDTGGEENHLLNTTELASHRHQETVTDYTGSNPGIPAYTGANISSGPGIAPATNSGQGGALYTVTAGGDTPHSVMSPFVALNYIIKV